MNRLQRLRQELATLRESGQTLLKAAEADDRDFTDAEEAQFATLEADITAKEAEVQAEERLAERRRTLGSSSALSNTVSDLNPETTQGFAGLGEFAVAVHGAVQAQQVGGEIDSRLRAAAPAGTHQGGGSEGEGYLLPPQYQSEVWDLMVEFDEFGALIDEEPTAARAVQLFADETTPWASAGIKAYWRAEGSKMTETQLSQEPRTVPLHSLYTLALATEELLEDAPRLNNRLGRKAAQAISYKKNLAIVEGTGAGQPMGWRNSGALIGVAKETGQAAGTITAANVIKMFSRLQRIPGDKPFWLINQDALEQLVTMVVGDRPVWMPSAGLADAPGGFLMGLPVRFSDFSESVGSQGDIELISPMGYYGARRAAGVQAATSIHLYFDRGIQAFRWMFRYGGQPHLSKPIAPRKGTATRSHFVSLAERA